MKTIERTERCGCGCGSQQTVTQPPVKGTCTCGDKCPGEGCTCGCQQGK